MKNMRKYGHKPYRVAVVHGGPGAPGEMASVARELSSFTGVLEPLQTTDTVEGQVEELRLVLQEDGDCPLVLVGFSWGAWLSFIVSAKYPSLVKKLILVSSGPFLDRYAVDIMKTRLSRLNEEEKDEVLSLLGKLDSSGPIDNNVMKRFGALLSGADSYDLLPHESETLECSSEAYRYVWEQASRMRSSGDLLKLGEKIQCPVVAIHGDYDPHPAEGVKEPLENSLGDFRFILLEKCGHYPWLERNAGGRFYSILKAEIG